MFSSQENQNPQYLTIFQIRSNLKCPSCAKKGSIFTVHLYAGSSVEEMEFNWDEYLEDTGATAAPHGSFKHVDTSLQNGFAPGMKLEVAVKSDQNTYWVATIITTCGQLLLLRYDGYGEDRKADFWCDIMTADLHPIGWCEQNKKILKVPEGIVPISSVSYLQYLILIVLS
uniref:Scm like with four mbt domains 1 n=1 Tax=Strix occidentalis caurina TaxID=311401 RepID=A0A8D0KR23_STROC